MPCTITYVCAVITSTMFPTMIPSNLNDFSGNTSSISEVIAVISLNFSAKKVTFFLFGHCGVGSF